MPDELVAAGRPDHARRQLERFETVDGVDAVSVSFPQGADLEAIHHTLEALAP